MGKWGLMGIEKVSEKVWAVATSAAEQNGCKLYDLEFVGSNQGRTLRVFIDRSEGVSVNDCEAVSRTLNLHLDQGDLIPGASYNLEVSSPGLDRILKRPEHFTSAIGADIQLRLKDAPEGSSQKQFTGKVLAVTNEGIDFESNGATLKVPFSNIEKGKMIFNFGSNAKNPKNKKKN